jgi:hypothetical protein
MGTHMDSQRDPSFIFGYYENFVSYGKKDIADISKVVDIKTDYPGLFK